MPRPSFRRGFNIGLAIVAFFSLAMVSPFAWVRWSLSRAENGVPADLKDALAPAPGEESLVLVLALEGVPYELMQELHTEGTLKSFKNPGRLVGPFPPKTALALSKMFQTGELAPEPEKYDYIVPPGFSRADFKDLKDRLFLHPGNRFSAYKRFATEPSGVEAKKALQDFLTHFETFVQEARQELPGSLKIILMSGGGSPDPAQRVDLAGTLTLAGYRNTAAPLLVPQALPSSLSTAKGADAPAGSEDFTIDPGGASGSVALRTDAQNAKFMCLLLRRLEGVDFCVYRQGGRLHILSSGGAAWVERSGERYRYAAREGDPLRLGPVVSAMRLGQELDQEDFAGDADWWKNTKNHFYPDPLHRLWSALPPVGGHSPTLWVSLKDGFESGASGDGQIGGDLSRIRSYGFFMTDFADSPDYLRPEKAGEILEGPRPNFNPAWN